MRGFCPLITRINRQWAEGSSPREIVMRLLSDVFLTWLSHGVKAVGGRLKFWIQEADLKMKN